MAEWSNAAVLKTVVPLPRDRGFESLFLRNSNGSRNKRDFFIGLIQRQVHLQEEKRL